MIELGIAVVLVVTGYIFGSAAERRHFKSIVQREQEMNELAAVASRFPPQDTAWRQQLVTGNVVIASDYFKTFTASLINIFGGKVTPFESLIDRARREALLRMKANAKSLGADYVFNVKYNTSRISQFGAGAIEVMAYGTALSTPDQPVLNVTDEV
jgi:uncharacterized protein YbjQ (UPF0145 family)